MLTRLLDIGIFDCILEAWIILVLLIICVLIRAMNRRNAREKFGSANIGKYLKERAKKECLNKIISRFIYVLRFEKVRSRWLILLSFSPPTPWKYKARFMEEFQQWKFAPRRSSTVSRLIFLLSHCFSHSTRYRPRVCTSSMWWAYYWYRTVWNSLGNRFIRYLFVVLTNALDT